MPKHSQRSSRTDNPECAIAFDRVRFSVNGAEILKEISLRIDSGEFVLILGPNGAGKTTLIRIINGLITPTSGTVHLFGRQLLPANAKNLRRRIAYLPQDIAVDVRIPITVDEVVGIGRLAHRSTLKGFRTQDQEIIDSAMEAVGVHDLRKRPFGQLSAGQKQKVSLARALAQEARVMLLDEPLNNLDPQAQEDICQTIDHIYGSTKKTILLVTHLLERIPQSSGRALLLRDGSVAGSVDSARTREKDFQFALYGARPNPDLGAMMRSTG
jgi:ABC-type Mn2+/Zn2+ transport system ATPase subunit